MSAVSSPPLNAAASPFGAPMFKVAAGENTMGMGGFQASPFAAAGSASGTNAPLTVGDVLPQLPPEVARHGALPPDQPVAISNQILDEALRSGQAAVPMFEIYRVCPALFQTPVSPQDPRMIPLPASKLPRLIAAAQSGAAVSSGPAQQAMPMMASPPPLQGSPFGTGAPSDPGGMMMEAPVPTMAGASTPSGMLLPPKRQGPPPPLAEVGSRDVSQQISLPGTPAFPMSPFASVGAEAPAQPTLGGQPFGTAPGMGGSPFGTSPGSAASPFMTKTEPPSPMAPASPFAPSGMAPSTTSPFSAPQAQPSGSSMGGQGSPFSASPAATAAAPPPSSSPFGAAPPAQGPGMMVGSSPFGSLFGDKAVPTGQPAPDAPGAGPRMVGTTPTAPPPALGPMSAGPAANHPANGPVRLGLASVLKGYTAAELGFDPMMVPAWITTSMPASAVTELQNSPATLAQLGFLIDGITDIGFRNVLNTARRDFPLRIDPELLHNAMAGSTAPSAIPNLSGPAAGPAFGTMTVAPPPNGGMGALQSNLMRVEPPPGFAPAQAQIAPSPFGAQPQPGASMTASFVPSSSPSAESFVAPYPGGSPFAASASGPAPVQPSAFSMPPVGPLQPPVPAPAPSLAPTSQPSAPFQPLPSAFGAAPAFAPAPAASLPPTAPAHAPFAAFPNAPAHPPQDPFANPAASEVPLFQSAIPVSAPATMPFQASASPFQSPAASPVSAPLGYATSIPPAFASAAPAPLAPPPMFLEATLLPPEPIQAAPPAFQTFQPPAMNAATDGGFSSDQLLGQIQPPTLERSWSHAAAAAASGPLPPAVALERSASPVIDIPATPVAFFNPPPAEEAPPAVRAFVPPTFAEDEQPFPPPGYSAPAPSFAPTSGFAAPAPPAAPTPAARPSRPAAGHPGSSSLGVQTHDVNPDQIMLRALLDTDSDLTPQRVVELACGLPGIAACVCLQEGGTAISHAGAHKPQAREFQKQASQLAQHLRALAPLIGIDGAETFTMNSGDRLMTFCFPEGAILGVLHDAEPTLGLRDKITLIARELSRMIA
ncbi:MAG: hypothetical protein V4662_00035 [Verrucomicrobiota bacterium]